MRDTGLQILHLLISSGSRFRIADCWFLSIKDSRLSMCWFLSSMYFTEEGLVRFATDKYNCDANTDLSNMYAHLTNSSINKFSPTVRRRKECQMHVHLTNLRIKKFSSAWRWGQDNLLCPLYHDLRTTMSDDSCCQRVLSCSQEIVRLYRWSVRLCAMTHNNQLESPVSTL